MEPPEATDLHTLAWHYARLFTRLRTRMKVYYVLALLLVVACLLGLRGVSWPGPPCHLPGSRDRSDVGWWWFFGCGQTVTLSQRSVQSIHGPLGVQLPNYETVRTHQRVFF